MDYDLPKKTLLDTRRLRNDTIAAGRRHTVALQSDGKVKAVGDNKCRQCEVSEWSNTLIL
ncbi:RCC1 domain-containing protein [Paenibacillus amylolyticus]|nr:RCC1 domain-containing protein [Paenibacillus amylolyticus]WFR61079.1 RCC1 domain-containing protein [Paenibacillus amylolyticus]